MKVESPASINVQGCLTPFFTAMSVYLAVIGCLFFFCGLLQIIMVILIRLLQTATCNAINNNELYKPAIGYVCCNPQDSYQQITEEEHETEICVLADARCRECCESSSSSSALTDLGEPDDDDDLDGGRSSLDLNSGPKRSDDQIKTPPKRLTPKSSKQKKPKQKKICPGNRKDMCFCKFRSEGSVTAKDEAGYEAFPKPYSGTSSSKLDPDSSKSTGEQNVASITPSDHSEHKLSCYCKKKLGLT